MRAVIQRVDDASVSVAGELVGAIESGLLLYLAVASGDGEYEVAYILGKTLNLRIFEDGAGRMNRSLLDLHAEQPGAHGLLVISQFTLYGDLRKGRRPSYNGAAEPERARTLYERFVELARGSGIPVATGIFGALMEVSSVNRGPVTLLVDSSKRF